MVLFDSLNSDFDLTYVLRGNSGSWEKLPAQATAEQGVGTLLNYKMLSTEKLQVKVKRCFECYSSLTCTLCMPLPTGDGETEGWAVGTTHHFSV